MLFAPLVAPTSALFLLMLSVGYYITFISLKIKSLGYSEYVVGFMGSCYYMGLFLGALSIEPFIRRIGHIRAFSFFSSLCTGSILLQAFFQNLDPSKGLYDPILWFWALMRALGGYCVAGLYVVIESWLLSKSSPSNRGVVISIYMFFLYAAHSLSQFFEDYLPVDGMSPFLVAAFFVSIATIPLLITYSATPDLHKPSMQGVPFIYRSSPLGFWGCVFSGIILSSLFSFTPVFAIENGFVVSWFVSALIMGGCLLQLPIGKLSDWSDRRYVLVGLALFMLLPVVAIYLFIDYPIAVYLSSFLLGGLCFAIYPVSISHVCDRIDPKDIVAATGLLLLVYSVGCVIGPLLTSYYIEYFAASQSKSLFSFMALVGLIFGLYGLWRIYITKRVPQEEKGDFVAYPHQSPVVSDLNPRNDETSQHE